MKLVRFAIIGTIALGLAGLPVASGCGSPCGNLWKKLEGCAKTDTERGDYKSKTKRKVFLAQCKKSDKSRIKQCIKLKDCSKLRPCATRIGKKYK